MIENVYTKNDYLENPYSKRSILIDESVEEKKIIHNFLCFNFQSKEPIYGNNFFLK